MRRPCGNFYAYTRTPVSDGRTNPSGTPITIAHEVGYQVHSAKRARALVDAADLPGYVEYWSERQQRRIRTCERDADGSWWVQDMFTGERLPLDENAETR